MNITKQYASWRTANTWHHQYFAFINPNVLWLIMRSSAMSCLLLVWRSHTRHMPCVQCHSTCARTAHRSTRPPRAPRRPCMWREQRRLSPAQRQPDAPPGGSSGTPGRETAKTWMWGMGIRRQGGGEVCCACCVLPSLLLPVIGPPAGSQHQVPQADQPIVYGERSCAPRPGVRALTGKAGLQPMRLINPGCMHYSPIHPRCLVRPGSPHSPTWPTRQMRAPRTARCTSSCRCPSPPRS